MKPAPFDYYAPTSLADATSLLAEMGDEGKVIAGGQSLVPMLNLRLARFEALVDVTRVPELRGENPHPVLPRLRPVRWRCARLVRYSNHFRGGNLMDRPITDFDHHSPDLRDDPAAVFQRVRETNPVTWTDNHEGFWVVVGNEQVQRIARDHATFSSARPDPALCSLVVPPSPSPTPYMPEESDPPLFYRYRRPFNEILSPSAVERLGPTVDAWTDHFIDEFIEDGHCDLAHDLASPVPACVTLEWLGLPTENWPRYAETMHALPTSSPGSERFATAREGMMQIAGELRGAIAERRRAPGDDVVSYLVQHGDRDEALTDDEIMSMLSIAVIGGIDTTTSLMTHAIVHLARQPDDRARLVADPSLLDAATEEFLRMYPPAMGHVRTVTSEAEVAGCQFSAGDRVFLSWAAANRDPDAFPDAEQFVIDRFPNRHFAFGTGIHRCVGSHLARRMFKSMMRGLLDRVPEYEIDESNLVPYPNWSAVSGWDTVPATFPSGLRSRETRG